MSHLQKLIVSTVIAAVITTVYSSLQKSGLSLALPTFDPGVFLALLSATVLTALFTNSSGKSGETSESMAATGREQGEVKWFNANKGFGFITRDNGGDIFVHFRSIQGEGRRGLRDGQRVEYDVVDSDKGLQAEDVCPV